MIQTHENVFDRLWLSEVCDTLLNKEAWYANNVANRNTWPYGNDGTHRLLGINFFLRRNENHILTSSSNTKLTNDLVNAFDYIKNALGLDLLLQEISANLQFMGMNGTTHIDGKDNEQAFILMLCDETLPKDIGGEFYHKPSNKKIKFKHGKLMHMTASDEHLANAFNKPIPRMSIKWVGRERT